MYVCMCVCGLHAHRSHENGCPCTPVKIKRLIGIDNRWNGNISGLCCLKRKLLLPVPGRGSQTQWRDGDRGAQSAPGCWRPGQPERALISCHPSFLFCTGPGAWAEGTSASVYSSSLSERSPPPSLLPGIPLIRLGTQVPLLAPAKTQEGGGKERTSWRLSVPGHSTLPQA